MAKQTIGAIAVSAKTLHVPRCQIDFIFESWDSATHLKGIKMTIQKIFFSLLYKRKLFTLFLNIKRIISTIIFWLKIRKLMWLKIKLDRNLLIFISPDTTSTRQ